MKFLLLLGLFLLIAYVWRSTRAPSTHTAKPGARPAPTSPSTMLACAHCGVHVPAEDAIPGRDGAVYCTEAHRKQREP